MQRVRLQMNFLADMSFLIIQKLIPFGQHLRTSLTECGFSKFCHKQMKLVNEVDNFWLFTKVETGVRRVVVCCMCVWAEHWNVQHHSGTSIQAIHPCIHSAWWVLISLIFALRSHVRFESCPRFLKAGVRWVNLALIFECHLMKTSGWLHPSCL